MKNRRVLSTNTRRRQLLRKVQRKIVIRRQQFQKELSRPPEAP